MAVCSEHGRGLQTESTWLSSYFTLLTPIGVNRLGSLNLYPSLLTWPHTFQQIQLPRCYSEEVERDGRGFVLSHLTKHTRDLRPKLPGRFQHISFPLLTTSSLKSSPYLGASGPHFLLGLSSPLRIHGFLLGSSPHHFLNVDAPQGLLLCCRFRSQ